MVPHIAVLSYFLGAVLDTAGIKDPITQTNINLGLNCLQFVIAMAGAACVDRLGRRPLLLFTNAACSIVYVLPSTSYSKLSYSDFSKLAGHYHLNFPIRANTKRLRCQSNCWAHLHLRHGVRFWLYAATGTVSCRGIELRDACQGNGILEFGNQRW